MPDDKKEPKASDILHALHELIQAPEEDLAAKPLEEVRAELKRRGILTAPLVGRIREQLAKARADVELTAARQERGRLLEQLKGLQSKLENAPAELRDRAVSVLGMLSSKNPAAAAAYFSKFENASDADLQSLLDDLNLLDESDHGEDSSGEA
jgi:hypothetical protein